MTMPIANLPGLECVTPARNLCFIISAADYSVRPVDAWHGGFHPTWLFCTNMPVIQRNRLHLQRCRISDYFSVVFMAHSLRWLPQECLSRNRQ